MPKENVTPVRRQYLDIKKQYPDSIIFFRLGDFYETFDEDAHTVSRVLDIVLTSRSVGKGVRVPMAGIPHHAAENYLSRLIEQGYHVAICDQVGDIPVDGLMPREGVRVITPGTILESSLLPGDGNNYLASIIFDELRAGIAYVDITTGEFAVTEIQENHIQDLVRSELLRLNPAEALIPNDQDWEDDGLPIHFTSFPAWQFEEGRCVDVLQDQFQVKTLEGFGVRGLPYAVRAAGAILQYLKQTRPDSLKLLTGLSIYSLQEFMTLDAATRRNLELTETIRSGTAEGSLLGILDQSITPMGKRLIRQWVSKPLLDVERIKKRLQGVTVFFTDGMLRVEVRERLKNLQDLERLSNRVAGGTAHPRDLVGMRDTLAQLPNLRGLFPKKFNKGEYLGNLFNDFSLCSDAWELLNSSLVEDPPSILGKIGIIKSGYSEELDNYLSSTKDARDWINNLESIERKNTGIETLKVSHNKVFGYYIEVTKAKTDRVPEYYIRKQTLVNAERYITPELKEYETKVFNAEDHIKEIERRLFFEICDRLALQIDRLVSTSRVIAHIDVLASLAETAANHGYVCPEVVDEDILEIKSGRHAVVEQTLQGSRFVPNDTIFETGERIRILTGPNMSGKSTFLRQVA